MRGAVVSIAGKKIPWTTIALQTNVTIGPFTDIPIIRILSPGKKQITEATTWVRDRRVLLSRIILAESSNRLKCL